MGRERCPCEHLGPVEHTSRAWPQRTRVADMGGPSSGSDISEGFQGVTFLHQENRQLSV